jgi:PhnB protein
MTQRQTTKPDSAGKGFRTVTPYVIVEDAAGMIEFVKRTFAGEEISRAIGSAGGIHCEMQVGDCKMMIGGGGRGLSWRGTAKPMAFHIYVRGVDATYRLALEDGASSLQPPADQPWGERTANVKDPFGNYWYIATFQGENYFSEGAPTVQPYLHPVKAEPVIRFLEEAFGATETGRVTSPEGAILHTTLKIGDAALEMMDAAGPYQPMPSTFYLYVDDVDAAYRKALAAGATSSIEPADQSFGDRMAGVKDLSGNEWYIARKIAESGG